LPIPLLPRRLPGGSVEELAMITRRAALAGLGALPIGGAAAQQPAFPSKPLTMIVPFPAGGPADIFGRFLAEGMVDGLG
jgi:tripartite-type tricarboxylate transporter receptor subunit TctC